MRRYDGHRRRYAARPGRYAEPSRACGYGVASLRVLWRELARPARSRAPAHAAPTPPTRGGVTCGRWRPRHSAQPAAVRTGTPASILTSVVLRRTCAAMSDADFLRYVGRRAVEEEDKEARVLDGEGNLGLRADASCLSTSSRFGAIFFACTAEAFAYAQLADVRAKCEPGQPAGAVKDVLHTVECGAPLLLMRLGADDTRLAVVSDGDSPLVLFFDTVALLRGRCALRHPEPLRVDARACAA
eukprot:6192221-Pleurochrysis_carterae.AAC.7